METYSVFVTGESCLHPEVVKGQSTWAVVLGSAECLTFRLLCSQLYENAYAYQPWLSVNFEWQKEMQHIVSYIFLTLEKNQLIIT